MQKIKSIALALVIGIVATGLSVATASASVILNVDGSGQLTGAQNVDVDGTLYDVTFMDGTCIALFNGCDDPSDFAFNTSASANAAAQALLDYVFINTAQYQFDSNPALTQGCSDPEYCFAEIPWYYAISLQQVLFVGAANHKGGNDDTPDFSTSQFNFTTVGNNQTTFAIFAPAAPAAIPEPWTLLLFAAGLVGLAGFGRRHRQG